MHDKTHSGCHSPCHVSFYRRFFRRHSAASTRIEPERVEFSCSRSSNTGHADCLSRGSACSIDERTFRRWRNGVSEHL